MAQELGGGTTCGTILKYTQQSTPTIVYRHGIDMIEQLATLKP